MAPVLFLSFVTVLLNAVVTFLIADMALALHNQPTVSDWLRRHWLLRDGVIASSWALAAWLTWHLWPRR